jgi:hypothetical protein
VKLLGYLIVAGAVLTVLKFAVLLTLVSLVLLLIWGALFRPACTFGFLVLVVLFWFLQHQPIVGWGLLAVALLMLRRFKGESPGS